MPAYNFQKQFIAKILDRSKMHTIRRRRKRPTKAHDMLMLYTGMRTKQCSLIAISECVKVEPIRIYPDRTLQIGLSWLTKDDIDELARHDGFQDRKDFFQFFEDHYELPTEGFEIITWDIGDVFMPVMGGRAGEISLKLGGGK